MSSEGRPDVDAVLTTRELAYLIKDSGIDLQALPDQDFDDELPAVAATDGVYCVPGDITRAVLRAAHGLLAQDCGSLNAELTPTASEGLCATKVQLNGFEVKAAAVAGWKNAVPVLEAIKSGQSEFAFLEVLACPMGCVSGGGQPKVLLPQDRETTYSERAKLASAAGDSDWEGAAKHPAVQQIYRGFFGKACGDKSNRALHTQYRERRLEGKLGN
jgi:iron only hydrogenase large subunit-like protein